MQDLNLFEQLRVVRPAKFIFDVLDVIVLLLRVIKVDVADEIHDVGDIDSVALHKLNAEVHIVQNRDNLTVCFLLRVEHQIFALIILILLLRHRECILVKAELDKGMQRLQILGQLAEGDNEEFLIILALHGVHGCGSGGDLFELYDHLIELLDKEVIVRDNNAGSILRF